ncbi:MULTISPECIES: polysaccharide deacetylase family protein [Streptomyces]|uniref:NodB homology domain-containing protein n=2 Tax=Streptomyces TaxID=1883 RepID=A0ABP3P655_9ACTN|nr:MULTISPECIES: polysaccharide deacetylase family protein [unclassified Streptomyces]WTA83360.1 polysaccharide deacetylase family protein [Streptomyces antimycoticus]WTB06162.1 polysaccharide deacetylase family protein [Streptomyces antimycoticus]
MAHSPRSQGGIRTPLGARVRAAELKITSVMMIKAGLSRFLVLTAAVALTGCGALGSPRPHSGAGKAADPPSSASAAPHAPSGTSGAPTSGSGHEDGSPPSAPAAFPGAYRRWGLDRPLAPPPRPPAVKPPPAAIWPPTPGLPTVIRRVATTDRVVFLTLDDGIEKDPAFVDQARDLGLPFTQFLEDEVIGDHYDYFGRLRELGNRIGNHTLTHPKLAGQDYDTQLHEICGQQDVLHRSLGLEPRLFRPPYGEYDRTTLRAAAECGLRKVVLWRAEMEPDGLAYRSGDGLRPGDIILAHFRGPDLSKGATMTDMITSLLREIQAQGFTVARLEDYI